MEPWFEMVGSLIQQSMSIMIQYNIGIIVFFLMPFYGIYHKFDRDYFIDFMKELWHNNRSITGPIGYVVAFPILFLIYGYKTAWDRFNAGWWRVYD